MAKNSEELVGAIAVAYPGVRLEIFVDECPLINKKLSEFAGGENDTEVVYDLLKYAESEGIWSEILKALAAGKPNNKDLQKAVEAALREEQPGTQGGHLIGERLGHWLDLSNRLAKLIAGFLQANAFRAAIVIVFAYALILTLFGSIPVSTKLQIPREGQVVEAPPIGHSVVYNDYYYGVNPNGDVRVSVAPLSYIGARTAGSLEVEVALPGGGRLAVEPLDFVSFSRVRPISLSAGSSEPGPARTRSGSLQSTTRTATSEKWPVGLVGRAHAAEQMGGRLYVQNVTLRSKSGAPDVVTASLVSAKATSPLYTLSADLISRSEAQLVLKDGALGDRRFQHFFELPQPAAPAAATIRMQQQAFSLSTSYAETFNVPANLPLGKEVTIRGNRDGAIVVQLAYPVDVVFFERKQTPDQTEKLIPAVSAAGFAARVNGNAARLDGEYNVIYSGLEVPNSLLRRVLKIALDSGVNIKSVQPRLKLGNGVQTQIQLGSSIRVRCLPKIAATLAAQLTNAQSDADFAAALDRLPEPECS